MDDNTVKQLLICNNRINSHYKQIISKNNELQNYLLYRYNDSLSTIETIYRIYKDIHIRPVCSNCGKPVKFISGLGFRETCSVSCSKHITKNIQIKCNDDIIINEYKDSGPKNKTSNKFLEEHGYKEYLTNRYIDSSTITETIYRIINNIEEKPKCEICGKSVRLISYEKGFDNVCSDICMRKNGMKLSDISDEYIKSISDTAAYKNEFRYYNLLLQYCKNKFGDKFRSYQESMYLIRNDMNEPPKCPICGKYIEYNKQRVKKYTEYCSTQCYAIAKRIKWRDRLIDQTGYNITLDDESNFVFHNVCNKHPEFTLTSLMAHNRCMESRINHMRLLVVKNKRKLKINLVSFYFL